MGDAGARYVIPTARTSLRPVSMEDVEALHRLWTDPEVRRFFWDDEVMRGFATEFALALLRYGLERAGLTGALGIADAENVASRRVLEKVGMTFQGYILTGGRQEARYEIRRQQALYRLRRQHGAEG
jgi:RimJ/RimL family protein N-acetyltransferase